MDGTVCVFCFPPVVSEQRRRFRDPVSGRLLDEARHRRVALPAIRLREGAVCHLADEHVLEGELTVALETGAWFWAYEVPGLQRVEGVVEFRFGSEGCQ